LWSRALREPAFSFDATPGKLPKTVVPINYAIELRPDAESLALDGVEVIDIEVRERTARLTLNAVNTTFASVTVDDGAERADVALDAAAEMATFTFARPLAAHAGSASSLRRGSTSSIAASFSSIIRPTTAPGGC
jgi:aminopeptidase N